MLIQAALVAGAGLLAGAANAIAGGGTLLTFPALLAAGLPPITANITSSIGLLPGYAGGAVAYRRELGLQKNRLRFLILPTIIGGILGALLLLITPSTTFQAVVPYLILMSCVLLSIQPQLATLVTKARARSGTRGNELGPALYLAVFLASIYGSFFGAGLGVLLLAVLGIYISDHLQHLNGLKSLLSLLVVIAGVIIYLVSGQARLDLVAILLVTSYVGGAIGGTLARQIPQNALRWIICALGTIVALVMLVHP
ncbi:sulfite exporter TauE/SafE family protein [Arthrobacter sp. 2MCAF15]|uniref:sulfite exporter TauE/SafE family protein n=1 Tax=Arthrobacter sp. 2MCAF15 TaxID=3232984 RepID=UPI003F915759